MNNYNYSHQSPIHVNHNPELLNVEDLPEDGSESDIIGTNQITKESDSRSPSSSTIEPRLSPTTNNLSPSPQDSPRLSESNQDQFLNNNFFAEGHSESINGSDSLFELTPDQLQAGRELELRKQKAEYDDDYDFGINYDDVPEYDVRAKIQSLNAQLADEPFPPETEHRNSKVVFRDEIISLVIPPENDGQSETDPDDPSFNTDVSGPSPSDIGSDVTNPSPVLATDTIAITKEESSETEPIESNVVIVEESKKEDEESEPQPLEIIENKPTESDEHNRDSDSMVVSRGGEFHVIGSNDIINGSKSNYNDDGGDHKQTKNRPMSAAVSKRNNKSQSSNKDGNGFSKSENVSRSNSFVQKQNDRSKLQIPRVDKDALRRQQERKKKEEEENMKREEEEQKMRKEMNTKSFEAWLQLKQKHRKEEDERKKKEDEEEREKTEKLQDERKKAAEEKEKELSKKLENERRKEDKLRQYRLKEMEDSMIVHSKAECKKAFKDWLKKKHRDHQSKIKEERQRARITRLAMRQCRKSQDLAQAIQQSGSFRYLDFCGYP